MKFLGDILVRGLMQNIREDKGYTYSIYSHLATMKEDAFFVIKSEVKKEKWKQVLEEIHHEIDQRIKNEPVDKKELLQAKNYLKGSILNSLYLLHLNLTEKLKNIYLYDLTPDFYDRLFDTIDSTDECKLIQLANTHLFDQPLSSVVVG